ncbi:hypothetical protein [Streptomyces sp. UNOC14_S4]|uniref:hypothetical protein n=1 Tax=Streptomyces sp. UNOC14_S4 TaxID=2872340 RepID=UPI001E33A551|nr:hypothetical protein [Streptomyces sp. UNOC14_S4]MCC3769632.1 hypothetical protein [Streptomyces sp. UNOC14_S4]
MKAKTYPQPSVELPLKLDSEPEGDPHCGVCTSLFKERSEAQARGDGSKVSDCNVELRNHPHKGHQVAGRR